MLHIVIFYGRYCHQTRLTLRMQSSQTFQTHCLYSTCIHKATQSIRIESNANSVEPFFFFFSNNNESYRMEMVFFYGLFRYPRRRDDFPSLSNRYRTVELNRLILKCRRHLYSYRQLYIGARGHVTIDRITVLWGKKKRK